MKVPVCDYCKHYIDDPDVRGMCCKAFPDGIPLTRMRFEDDGTECANGIKFEERNENQMKFVSAPDSILVKMHRI